MNYMNWKEKTCRKHGVFLEGWPLGIPHNPKNMNIMQLNRVLEDISANKIYYRLMTEEERALVDDSEPAPSANTGTMESVV